MSNVKRGRGIQILKRNTPTDTPPEAHSVAINKVKSDTDAFLASGGEIKQVPQGHSGVFNKPGTRMDPRGVNKK